MSVLALLTLGLVVLLAPLHAMLLSRPVLMQAGMLRFPRHRWLGWGLAIVAIVWAAWLLHQIPLGRFDFLKQWLIPITITFAALVCIAMQELLAPRALGALLMLYPAPVLQAARLHPSGLSVIMSVIAYVMVVKGMALMLSPYFFRHAVERFLSTAARCRLAGLLGLVFDAVLLVLALLVY